MNIGDKVRMLHGNEEGIIRKISGSRVEIEIEDGFLIPALKNEIVVIHSSEKTFFDDSSEPELTENQNSSSSPDLLPFFALIPQNDNELIANLINPSGKSFLIRVNAEKDGLQKTIFANTLPSNQWAQLDRFRLKEISDWPILHFICLPISNNPSKQEPSFDSFLRFKPKNFSRASEKLPLIEQKGYSFELFRKEKELDISSLNRDLNDTIEPLTSPTPKPLSRVDLHIEELIDNHDGMSNSEILRTQLEVFEKNLNQAISSGMDEITFVHGIGNGVLRKEIQKRLSEIKNIKYFKDTQKDRWGYGATLVRIS